MTEHLSNRALRALACGHWFLDWNEDGYKLVIHFPSRVWRLPFIMLFPRQWVMLEKNLETNDRMTALILAKQELFDVFGDEYEVLEQLTEAH